MDIPSGTELKRDPTICGKEMECFYTITGVKEGPDWEVQFQDWWQNGDGGRFVATTNNCIWHKDRRCCDRSTPTEPFYLAERQVIGFCRPPLPKWPYDCELSTSNTMAPPIQCPSTTTTTPTPQRFGWATVNGEGQACRGASATDTEESYYAVVPGVENLEVCQVHCEEMNGFCKGMEFSMGRCELWTRYEGIQATLPKDGFTCLKYLAAPIFLPADRRTNRGKDRVCRGALTSDNSPEYYTVLTAYPKQCQEMCMHWKGCVGIEYNNYQRCEIWTRPNGIGSTVISPGHVCLRYEAAMPTQVADLYP